MSDVKCAILHLPGGVFEGKLTGSQRVVDGSDCGAEAFAFARFLGEIGKAAGHGERRKGLTCDPCFFE